MLRAAIFIDFWNLIRGLASSLGPEAPKFDWDELVDVLISTGGNLVSTPQVQVAFEVHGVYVYASATPSGLFSDRWFKDNLKTKPGYIVKLLSRKQEKLDCSVCARRFKRSREKGVDASLISDLMWLAWQDRYDVAFLVSADRDMIPTIERVQISGRRVISVTPSSAIEVPAASFASISVEDLFFEQFGLFYRSLERGPSLDQWDQDYRRRVLAGDDFHDLVIERARSDPRFIARDIIWYLRQFETPSATPNALAEELGFVKAARGGYQLSSDSDVTLGLLELAIARFREAKL